MTNEQRSYFAYLLRLWCVDANGEVMWRASIEDPHTGERHGFASIDRLWEFLREQTQDINRSEEAGGDACQRSNHLHKDDGYPVMPL